MNTKGLTLTLALALLGLMTQGSISASQRPPTPYRPYQNQLPQHTKWKRYYTPLNPAYTQSLSPNPQYPFSLTLSPNATPCYPINYSPMPYPVAPPSSPYSPQSSTAQSAIPYQYPYSPIQSPVTPPPSPNNLDETINIHLIKQLFNAMPTELQTLLSEKPIPTQQVMAQIPQLLELINKKPTIHNVVQLEAYKIQALKQFLNLIPDFPQEN